MLGRRCGASGLSGFVGCGLGLVADLVAERGSSLCGCFGDFSTDDDRGGGPCCRGSTAPGSSGFSGGGRCGLRGWCSAGGRRSSATSSASWSGASAVT
ncbi:MAG: hypothetical protein WAW78_01955, partial [Propioniciclava sp.]